MSVNVERLQEVVRVLREDVPDDPRTFDMRFWTDRVPKFDSCGELEGECGTSHCAIGWACEKSKKFEEDGFYLHPLNFWPHYLEESGLDAIQLYFNLSKEDAVYLFAPYISRAYISRDPIFPFASKEAVTQRIEKFISLQIQKENFSGQQAEERKLTDDGIHEEGYFRP